MSRACLRWWLGNLTKTIEGGGFSDTGYIVNSNPALLTDNKSWIVSYASYLSLLASRHACAVIVAADNWAAHLAEP